MLNNMKFIIYVSVLIFHGEFVTSSYLENVQLLNNQEDDFIARHKYVRSTDKEDKVSGSRDLDRRDTQIMPRNLDRRGTQAMISSRDRKTRDTRDRISAIFNNQRRPGNRGHKRRHRHHRCRALHGERRERFCQHRRRHFFRLPCDPPSAPEHGYLDPIGVSQYRFRSSVSFVCHHGYVLHGASILWCEEGKKWSGLSPTCQLANCGDPHEPMHGHRQGNLFTFGSQVIFICDEGYRLQGYAVSRCQADSTWDHPLPSCQATECSPLSAPDNGWVNTTQGRTYGNEAVYGCQPGYSLRGLQRRLCQGTGHWTGGQPTCQAVYCEPLAPFDDGSVSYSSAPVDHNSWRHGDVATFTCFPGYSLHGSTIRTCADGIWEGTPTSCNVVSCGDPGTPEHGTKMGNAYTFSENVTFLCKPGYHLEGEIRATCQENGVWSSVLPLCLVCAVNTYKAGTTWDLSCSPCPEHSVTAGLGSTTQSACVCDTEQGYVRNEAASCTRVTCPLPESSDVHVKEGTCRRINYPGDTCEWTCTSAGYFISSGDAVRSCEILATWSGTQPQCSPCPVNTYKESEFTCERCPANSHTNGIGNEEMGCICDNGFHGNYSNGCQDIDECSGNGKLCDQDCVNTEGSYRCVCSRPGYTLSPTNPHLCIEEYSCDEFSLPAHGGAVCITHVRTGTLRCTIKCDPGYEHLERPNAFEECGASTNFLWTYVIQDQPIMPCIEQWFEEIRVEVDVFYFVESCVLLTEKQMFAARQEFLAFLESKGFCKDGSRQTCVIDDVSVDCGAQTSGWDSDRKRRSNHPDQLTFSVQLKMEQVSAAQINCSDNCRNLVENSTDCQENCKNNYMESAMGSLEQTTTKMARVFGQNGSDINERSILHVANTTFMPKGEIIIGSMELKCGSDMGKTSHGCVPCPAGTYLASGSDECTVCDVGYYQPVVKQTSCLPCHTSRSRGMTVCPPPTPPPTTPQPQQPTSSSASPLDLIIQLTGQAVARLRGDD